MRCLVTAMLLAISGCNAITQPPPSPAPQNSCAGSCSGYDAGVSCLTVGSGLGACQVSEIANPFVLIVSVPTFSTPQASTTYAITSDDLLMGETLLGANRCQPLPARVPSTPYCYALTPPVSTGGAYLVTAAQAVEADRPIGPTSNVTLPTATTFWPQWVPPAATAPVDARALGLPLPPIVAEENELSILGMPYTGPGGGPPLGWSALLPPLPSRGTYLGVVQVVPPFDNGFPDQTYEASGNPNVLLGGVATVQSSTGTATVNGYVVEVPPGGLTVERDDGSALGAGWSVHFRDPATQSPISSRATLGPKQTVVRLNVFNPTNPNPDPAFAAAFIQSGPRVVVAPPPGVELPTLVLGVTNTAPVPYPSLPPVVHVSGKLLSRYRTSVSGTVLFYSSDIDDVTACATGEPTPNLGPPRLFYETSTVTDDQLSPPGQVGAFKVDLPQGRYTYVVVPAASSGYAKTIGSRVAISLKAPVCGGPSPSLALPPLGVEDLIPVTGRIVTADGRPLANAEVDLAASALLATSVPPAPLQPFAQDLWPRPFTTTTNANGEFSVEVDPASEYGMTIKPQPGTNFPWVVRPYFAVYAPRALDTVTMPAPLVLGATLQDSTGTGSPLANAVVQAYSFWKSNQGPVALAIGEAMTDANGQFRMMLTTSFPSN